MKTITAMNIIQKECRFLGMDINSLIKDVKKHGRMVYSDRVVEAIEFMSK